jgi:hypothetical protein
MIQVTIHKSDNKTASGICNGKPFAAFLESVPGALPGYGKWCVIDPDNFTFGERLIIAKAVRGSFKALGLELAHHLN